LQPLACAIRLIKPGCIRNASELECRCVLARDRRQAESLSVTSKSPASIERGEARLLAAASVKGENALGHPTRMRCSVIVQW
jgi:hypothetical protein